MKPEEVHNLLWVLALLALGITSSALMCWLSKKVQRAAFWGPLIWPVLIGTGIVAAASAVAFVFVLNQLLVGNLWPVGDLVAWAAWFIALMVIVLRTKRR